MAPACPSMTENSMRSLLPSPPMAIAGTDGRGGAGGRSHSDHVISLADRDRGTRLMALRSSHGSFDPTQLRSHRTTGLPGRATVEVSSCSRSLASETDSDSLVNVWVCARFPPPIVILKVFPPVSPEVDLEALALLS